MRLVSDKEVQVRRILSLLVLSNLARALTTDRQLQLLDTN
jgi:hypothetical protein